MESYHVRHQLQAKWKCRKGGGKKSPKQVKELYTFEKDLIAVVKDIKLRNTRSDFQTALQEDIRLIHNSKKTITFADKTSNMCQLTKEEHDKLSQNAITSKYKKTNTKIKNRIKNYQDYQDYQEKVYFKSKKVI